MTDRTDAVETEWQSDDQQWPGVGPAQAYIIPSYTWMLSRLESADSRLQNLLTLIATVTLAAPTFGPALHKGISFASCWFLVAMALAVAGAAIGIYARARGAITLPHPTAFWDRWLGYSEWEFQKNALRFAGHHFEKNLELVKRKSIGVTLMSSLFVGEVALLVTWVASA